MENLIQVDAASPNERALIEGLFQFYAYDFSEMFPPGSPLFPVGADGRFRDYPHMESYWRDQARIPLIIRNNGEPAGFALINHHSPTGAPLDRNMAEFFVMRPYRCGGVGSGAVRTILTRYPGRWQIAIAERNAGAKVFWPRAVAAVDGIKDLVTLQGDGQQWTGPILSFRV